MSDSAFALPAAVDFDSLVSLRSAGEDFIGNAPEQAVFSLAELSEANSAAVALMMSWYRYAHTRGKSILYTRASPEVRNIGRVSGLEDILPLDPAD